MKRFIFISSLFISLVYILQAQELSFSASAPATIRAGQQFQYVLSGNERVEVELPKLDGLEILGGPYTNFMTSSQWINGKMASTTNATYTYVMRFRKEGVYKIPSATVKHKKKTLETNEITVSVVASQSQDPQASQGSQSSQNNSNVQNVSSNTSSSGSPTTVNKDNPEVFLRIIPSKRTLYKGEQLISELKIFFRVNTGPVSGINEVSYDGFYKQSLEGDQQSEIETVNGQQYYTQVIQRHILIPQKAGETMIDAYDSEWYIPKKVKRQRPTSMFDSFFDDPFSDPFFDQVQHVPTLLSTSPVSINVKQLPAGAPKGFTGGVGDLKMTAALSSDECTENDALSLKITISGTGNLALIGAPKVDFPPDHDVYETTKSSNIKTNGNKISGSVTYEYPFVARHAGKFRIAPLSFSWFNPMAKQYETITSDEFFFVVNKGENSDEESQIFVAGSNAEAVENIGKDIIDINRASAGFKKLNSSPLSKTMYWLCYLIVLLLFAASIIFMQTYLSRKADVILSRNRKANKLAKSRLKIADRARRTQDERLFFEETEKAIWGYLSDKLSIELSSLSKDKVEEVLRNAVISDSLIAELFRIIDDCEFSRYAPTSEKSNINTLYEEAVRLIRQLEQNIK